MNDKRELLRHTVAALAYRASRALKDAPGSFAEFKGAGNMPVHILAHMGDLFDWALSIVQGRQAWNTAAPQPWAEEKQRFFNALQAFDAALASSPELGEEAERLFQGPIADALTHVGQLAMLRRLAGCPIAGENFYVAHIAAGQLGEEQPAPVRTF